MQLKEQGKFWKAHESRFHERLWGIVDNNTLPPLGAMERTLVREQLRTRHLLAHRLENDSKGLCREGEGEQVVRVPVNELGKDLRPRLLRLMQISQKVQEPVQTQT